MRDDIEIEQHYTGFRVRRLPPSKSVINLVTRRICTSYRLETQVTSLHTGWDTTNTEQGNPKTSHDDGLAGKRRLPLLGEVINEPETMQLQSESVTQLAGKKR